MKNYIFLAFAILFESVATSFLKASEGFTKPLQTIIFVVAMSASFYLLTHAIKVIPIGNLVCSRNCFNFFSRIFCL